MGASHPVRAPQTCLLPGHAGPRLSAQRKAAERIPHGQPDCSTNRLPYGVSDGLADTCTDSGSHDKSDGSTDRLLYHVADGLAGSGTHGSSHTKSVFCTARFCYGVADGLTDHGTDRSSHA